MSGNNDFALDLYQVLRAREGNLFYSPYSISLALAMTYAGARGETEQQMAQALGFVLTQNRLHPAFSHLTREFASRSEVLPARMNQGQSHRHHPVRRPGCEPRFLTLTPLSAKCKVR